MDELAYMFLGSPESRQDETASTTSRRSGEEERDTAGASEVDAARPAAGASTAENTDADVAAGLPQTPETPRKRRGIRDFLKKANLQDQLLDKLFQQVIPMDGLSADDADDNLAASDDADVPSLADDDGGSPPKHERPGFSVAIMSNNFRRFNARIGVVFRFQKHVERLLAWRRAPHTLALLGVYTLVCLNPYLLALLPPAIFVLAVLIPAFVARHPATIPANGGGGSNGHGNGNGNGHAYGHASSSSFGSSAVSAAAAPEYNPYARGPPLAPPRTVKPVKELSRDFFRNMGDLQNSMEDFSVAHDQVVQLVEPATNFSDEAFSSALFVALCAAATLLSVAAHLLPWRLMFLVGGWLAVCSGHPAVARVLRIWRRKAAASTPPEGGDNSGAQTAPAAPSTTPAALWNAWVKSDIILDEAPETREVEIFELQRRSPAAAAEWKPWLFSPSPYDPLSQPRLSLYARPTGARFFEDVLPPPGWEWSEKKWALDLWSREWVEERIITGVEVETEGERWVYDIHSEQEQQQQAAAAAAAAARAGFGDSDYAEESFLHPPASTHANTVRPPKPQIGPIWEEGDEGDEDTGRRGEWRRRRWVRTVRRKKITEET